MPLAVKNESTAWQL